MKGKYLFGALFAFTSVLVFIMPFIYAAAIENSIAQQIGQNQIIYNPEIAQTVSPEEILMKAIQDDPQVRSAVIKFVLILIVFAILMLIDLILRGAAMWKASKRDQKAWFWFLLAVNSLCILPIIYLLIYRKAKKDGKKK
ncbi:Uncharacterised protein [uncultured archaeon]|nr:Uncharacterised protein [uncultured archaeon]